MSRRTVIGAGEFAGWVSDFEAEAERRERASDPDWNAGARLGPEAVKSLQRFQVGESGDGANLMAKASQSGDPTYAAAVKMFIAEEQNHARLLARLLGAAGAPLIDSHWSDTVFVRLRRALGLRLELMVLFVAEFVALGYYRACRDGSGDALTSEVAARILDDEERHVRFHSQRLRQEFASLPAAVRAAASWAWLALMAGTVLVVVWDHGAALRQFGVSRWQFAARTLRGFRDTVAGIRAGA